MYVRGWQDGSAGNILLQVSGLESGLPESTQAIVIIPEIPGQDKTEFPKALGTARLAKAAVKKHKVLSKRVEK